MRKYTNTILDLVADGIVDAEWALRATKEEVERLVEFIRLHEEMHAAFAAARVKKNK